MSDYVDTHCHLDHHFDLGVAEQVERAREEGVTTLITVGTDMATSTQAVQSAGRHDGVWAVVGVHPNDAMEATPRVMDVVGRLARRDEVVGVGETGLDYYRDWTTPTQQERAFRKHIELARKLDKTLVIHCRDAWDDCLRVLEDAGPPDRVVMHCFSGDTDVVERCVEHGWYLSYAGNVTFRNAAALREAAEATPLELLLTETDSPYLSPEPYRGKPNESARIPHVLHRLAEVKGHQISEVRDAVAANAVRAFALPAAADDVAV